MISESNVRLTINFNDSSLEAEERDEQVQRLMLELKEIDDVETVERVLDTNPPEGNKALGGFLVGLMTAGVNAENAKRVLGFLGDRLSGKTIELEVEANGRKLKVKASSQAELAAAIEAAQKFVAA
jgi:hypothetical protein